MAEIDIRSDGFVTITDGDHRGVVEPHSIRVLNAIGGTLTTVQLQAINDKWATIPVPPPDPIEPPVNSADLAETQMRDVPFMRAWVKRQAVGMATT